MGEISHVAAHAAIIATFFTSIKGLVSRMRADFLEYATEDVVWQTLRLVRPMVRVGRGGVVIVAWDDIARFALLARKALEKAHDAFGRAGGLSGTGLHAVDAHETSVIWWRGSRLSSCVH